MNLILSDVEETILIVEQAEDSTEHTVNVGRVSHLCCPLILRFE